jgi:hypothetical protein
MAYQVNRYNGVFLVSVNDGTIDSSTDIRFLGKNYAGYGQVQNENFLHLMEHFAGSSQPSKPISGQLWFDTTNKKIKVYDGSKFKVLGGATASSSVPVGLASGEFWFEPNAGQLYCWNGREFTLIGPENPASLGETSVISQVVKDTSGKNQIVAKFVAGGTVVAVVSKGDVNTGGSFELDTTINNIPGFGKIRKGITLVDTNNDTGITLASSTATIWGTVSSSKALVDIAGIAYTPTDFVRQASPRFSNQANFADTGFTIGATNTILFSFDGTNGIIQNQAGDPLLLRIRVGSENRSLLKLTADTVEPGEDSAYTFGTTTKRWFQIFADNISVTENIIGNLIGSSTGPHKGNVLANDNTVLIDAATKTISGSSFEGTFTGTLIGTADTAVNAQRLNDLIALETATASSIAARDSSGNITANQFVGIANFADKILIDNSVADNPASSYKTAKTTKEGSTIAARTPAGDLQANLFVGTATAVVGADLAEKYLADTEYEIGTVMMVGGDAEITHCQWGTVAVGVVSGCPGLRMNNELEDGIFIALKGRVPVKVSGSVKKGDKLIAANNGCAMAGSHHSSDYFAIALESNQDTMPKLIEAIVL